jgi:polyisoprenoid-binding protein YceI
MTFDLTQTTETTAFPLPQGRWVMDSYHSSVGFTIRHLGISKVRGCFTRFEAELVTGETAEDCSVTATIALDSIDTGNAQRDEHLLAPDMLDVANRPTMIFRSTQVQGEGEDWTLAGELTIGEVTQPVLLKVDFGGIEESVVDGRRHAGFEASGELRRSDYGLGFATAMLSDLVKIQLDMQFIAPE